MKPQRLGDAALTVVVVAFGSLLSLHYGRIGFNPLDQSIVFDGGWRLLSGQVPFRDFTTPSGVAPILLQAAFFKVFGVTWFSYCLHAAVSNGLFCATVYAILRLVEGGRWLSFGYSLLSAVVFYPPFGVPYMDQHSFLFGAVAVLFAVAAARLPHTRIGVLAAVALPLALLLAYLSKQIPALFFLPLLALPLAAAGRRRKAALLLAVSSAAALAGVGLAACLWGVDWGQVLEFFVRLPQAAGEARLMSLGNPWRLAAALWTTAVSWGLLSVGAAQVGVLAGGLHLLLRPASAAKTLSAVRLLLAELLLLACGLFTVLTKNEAENGIPYVFLALALVHISLGETLRRRPLALWTLALILAAGAILDAYRFNLRVNETRLVLGQEDTPAPAVPPSLPEGLAFMHWRDPAFGGYSAADFGGLVAFLRDNPGNFLVMGDASILYGLVGRPSVNPVLWFHPRLTIPGRATPGFQDYERRLLANLERDQVRYVVVEMDGTFMGARPAYFPALVDYIQARIEGRRSFGSFDVIELGAPQTGTHP